MSSLFDVGKSALNSYRQSLAVTGQNIANINTEGYKRREAKLEEVTGRFPLRKEGVNEGRWALLDYGELIVHVLQPGERSFYDLEAFWGHGERRTFVASGKEQDS